MSAPLLVASAVLPALFLLWYLCSRDLNPEPPGVVVRTFLLGALVALPILPTAQALEALGARAMGMWPEALVKGFLGAAIPEELFKFLVLRLWVWRQPDFDEPMDGIVYGAAASLGFAAFENVLYVGGHDGGLALAALRAATAVPGHALTGVVMGYFVGRARFAPGGRGVLCALGVASAMLLHGAYDTALFTRSNWAALAIAVLAVDVWWARRLIATMRAEQRLVPPVRIIDFEQQHLPGEVAPPRPQRNLLAVGKLLAGALGACGAAFVALGTALVAFDPLADDRRLAMALSVIAAAAALGFAALFRSGLRGPFTSAST